MKKEYVLFFLLGWLLILPSLQAQELSLGLRAGFNRMSIRMQETYFFEDEFGPILSANESYQSLTGFQTAIFTEVRFSEFLAVQPELLIHQKGGSYSGKTTNPFGENVASYDIRTLQIDIPVLAKISTGDVFWRVSALVGPAFGLHAGGTYDWLENNSTGSSSVIPVSGLDHFNFSFIAGMAIEIDLGRGWFYVDGRYMNTLGHISLKNLGDTSFSNLAFSVGYSRPLQP